MKRIIYVIPYKSIIEQNAEIFRNICGEEYVLEHHSSFNFDKNEKAKLAAENWDIPIIVTTNVQFFESLFSNRSSKARKLYNMANSVVILDEAQMLPVPLLYPTLEAVKEIISKPKDMSLTFKRTQLNFIDKLSDKEIANRIIKYDKVLCIVNTRRHAHMLYELVKVERKTEKDKPIRSFSDYNIIFNRENIPNGVSFIENI